MTPENTSPEKSMTKPRKILLWVTVGFIALTILAIVAVSVLPHLINTEPWKGIVEKRLSEKLGVQFSYGSVTTVLLPRPGVIFHKGSIVMPDRMRGSFDSLDVRLNMLPVLRGSLQLSSLRVVAPKFSIRLEPSEKKKMPGLAELRGEMQVLLGTLSQKEPNLAIRMEKGNLTLLEKDRTVFSFSNLNADIVLPPEGPKIRITGSSNFADGMKVLLQMDQESLSGRGEIDLRDVRVGPVSRYFMSHSPVGVDGSVAGLNLSLTTSAMKTIEAEVHASPSALTVMRKGKKLTIRGKTLRGKVTFSDERTEVSLGELDLAEPRLALAGTLILDRAAGQIGLHMEGRGIDVRTMRQAAFSLAGDVPIVQSIFGYVRDGTIPLVTISSQAGSLDALGNTENIRIGAKIEKGEVFLEGPQLYFRDAYAKCNIVNGMLDGTDIRGGLEKIRLFNGRLHVGLKGAVVPLSLDAGVKADMGAVRNILERLVKNKAVLHELSLFRNMRGNAEGRLILRGKSDSPDVTADMRKITLSADYAPVPYPLNISGGGIYYDGKRVATKNLRGGIGGSSFSGLNVAIELKKGFPLAISSGSLNISLPETYRWMASDEKLGTVLQGIGSVEGTLAVSSLQVRGPLMSPQEWRFKMAGSGRDIAFALPSIPGSVAVATADIRATDEELSVSGAKVRMLDSAFDVSGNISGYMKKGQNIDLSMKGSVGPKSFGWISGKLNFPAWIRNTLTLSVTSSHLTWERSGAMSFSGVMNVANGPAVSLDLVNDKKGLRFNRLLIEDSSSRAEISAGLEDRKIDLAFSGKLTGKTAATLIAVDEQPTAWIAGDVTAQVLTGRPVRFTAQGKMQGDGFVIPLGGTTPLEIDRLSAEGDGKRLRLDSCDLKWGSDEVFLSGNVTSAETGIIVDMDAFADVIDAAGIAKKLKKTGKESEKQVESAAAPSWARGSVRVRAGRLKYDKISVAPFSADISLNEQGLGADVTEADFCGISVPGRVSIDHGQISVDFRPAAKDRSLESFISCLSHSFDINEYATGTFDLSGKITGKGGEKDFIPSIRGDIVLTARDGRIYYVPSVLKVLAFLSVSEIIKGYDDVWKKGLPYDKVVLKDTLRRNRVEMNEGTVDGPYIKMVSQGYIDLNANKMDVRFLVSPLRTVDRIIEHIPVLGYLLGYTLLSIPVRVSGDLKNPQVTPFSLSAADSGLLGLMKHTLTLPFKLFAPLFKGGKEKEKSNGAAQENEKP